MAAWLLQNAQLPMHIPLYGEETHCTLRVYDVVAVHAKCWDARVEDSDQYAKSPCNVEEDHARRVAAALGIPFHLVDLCGAFWEKVFRPTVDAFEKGVTLNADVLCNEHVKLGALAQHAFSNLGCDFFATGHYAQVARCKRPDGRSSWAVARAVSIKNDQSYYLSRVAPSVLARVIFPLGRLCKADVRDMAASGLPSSVTHEPPSTLARAPLSFVSHKPCSTGLCFIGERPFAKFLSSFFASPAKPLRVIDADGTLVHPDSLRVRHTTCAKDSFPDGHVLPFLTLGQKLLMSKRGGLHSRGVLAMQTRYVCEKDLSGNIVRLCSSWNDPRLYTTTFKMNDIVWHNQEWGAAVLCPDRVSAGSNSTVSCSVMCRDRAPLCPCTATMDSEEGSTTASVTTTEPVRAATPGQTAAFYCNLEGPAIEIPSGVMESQRIHCQGPVCGVVGTGLIATTSPAK